MALEHLLSASRLRQRSHVPRYQAIAEDIAQLVHSGQLPTGEKLPPQRVLAQRLAVTPGTVSRAYELLARRGVVLARVGDGTYVRAAESDPAIQTAVGAGEHGAPTLIDLAHNVAIPTDEARMLSETLQALAVDATALRDVLSYQHEAGLLRHRQAGAQWLRRFGTGGDAQRVMLTHGAQHGLACVLRTLVRPGDAVLTESLSYPGLLALSRLMRLQLVAVAGDAEGLLPDALDHAARHIDARVLVCAPTLHNPTTATMSLARREAIASVARRHQLQVVEDAVHAAALAHPLPALSTLLPEQSFLLTSFSKVLGPGLRVGYVEASPAWLSKLAAAMRADCWMAAPLQPEVLSRWIADGRCEVLIQAQRAALAERRTLALQALQGLALHSATDAPFLWLPLPEPWLAGALVAALRQAGVLVRAADHFAVGRAPVPHALRLSLNAAATPQQVMQGAQVLQALLNTPPANAMEP